MRNEETASDGTSTSMFVRLVPFTRPSERRVMVPAPPEWPPSGVETLPPSGDSMTRGSQRPLPVLHVSVESQSPSPVQNG